MQMRLDGKWFDTNEWNEFFPGDEREEEEDYQSESLCWEIWPAQLYLRTPTPTTSE